MTADLLESTEIQFREIEIREVDTEAREIVGIAVPYGEVYDLGGIGERFERGAFDPKQVVGIPLFYGHEHRTNGGAPIGKIVDARETDEGLEIRARLSDTPRGNEVHTLLRDGVVRSLSIGFEPVESRMDGDVVVRTAALAVETSVTPFPAYKTAQISEVRSEIDNEKKGVPVMEDTENTDVADLRDTVTDLERKIALLAEGREDEATKPQFRTAGALLKALARGEESAQAEFRAADGTGPATSAQSGADNGNGGNWISRPLKFVNEKRRVVNLFDTAPLPDSGNTVEYPKVASTSGTVDQQSAEGAALSYMEVELDTGSATVGTYGGYSSLSRQSIERSDESYLDAVLRFQAIQYAKATEADARAVLTALPVSTEVILGGDTTVGWIDLVIDGAAKIEDDSLGLQAEFMLVSRDVFKKIAHKVDSADRPVFVLNGDGTNTLGRADLVKATFSINGLRGAVDPNLPANSCFIASADAMTTLESPGAPFRLQDESVVNLTKDFSLYGYAAWTLNDANGVVRADVDLV